MSKEKRNLSNLLRKFKRGSIKKKSLIIFLSLLFFIFIGFGLYYSVALAQISESEVTLAALRENINKEKICHEDCLLIRKKQEDLVIAAIKKPEDKLLKRLEKYWSDPLESFEFKKEIINLWRLNLDFKVIPQYFYDYLDKTDGDVRLQALIISSFLSPNSDKQWVDYYFSLLGSSREASLKKEALVALSNRQDKAESFTLKQLVFLNNLLTNKGTPLEIKADVVLLIGDYYQLFPEETGKILADIYKSSELDNISRAFAADILNKNVENSKLTLPAISGQEWESYYNN